MQIGVLSGLNFCILLKLIRRLSQLVDLDDTLSFHSSQESVSEAVDESDDNGDEFIRDECGICMARPQDTVLPCLHGVCSSCEAKWVETHQDCPFCRKRFTNQRRRKKDQWQVSLLCVCVRWLQEHYSKKAHMPRIVTSIVGALEQGRRREGHG